jgi:microcystin-dependent protein
MDNFIGEVRLFAGMFAPQGWAYCDGSLLDISTNDALYTLLGTTYGGDGQYTFGLPDLRGRVPIHQGTLSQYGNSYLPGQTGGVETVPLTAINLPAHSHAFVATTNAGTTATPTGNLVATAPANSLVFVETAGTVGFSPIEVATTGSGAPHQNMQPYQAINYIIALEGIYPSQG